MTRARPPRSRRNLGNNKANSAEAEEHFQIRYLDLSRMIEVNDFKRFQSFAAKADLNALQIGVDMNSNENTRGGRESRESANGVEMNALEYAMHAKRDKIVDLIDAKLKEDSLEDRWLRVVSNGEAEAIEQFQKKFKASGQLKDFLQLGLVRSAELGSSRLIDYFIGSQKLDLNYTLEYKNHIVSPLLIAIENKKADAVKYLIFRKADINLVGEYGNALVTAIHYECSNELITLLLEKGASLASRHREWPSLNLREYCVQLNKVKAKAAIDDFVFRLIANGEYDTLKNLADNGYLTINVMNRFRKTGRDLAIERYHLNIVQLIDKIEYKQRRLKTKMNY